MLQLNPEVYKDEAAFAKIVSENGKEYYLKELECEIGRDAKAQGPKYFCLSDHNTVSKQHAKIYWDAEKDGWFIKNLSKNKVRIDGVKGVDQCESARCDVGG